MITSATYKCDRCGTEAKSSEGVAPPADWAIINVQGLGVFRAVNLCTTCAGDLIALMEAKGAKFDLTPPA
jgi:predicted RNA-binding Zn-ribbon protein involved in translation (DUF1610 family)